MFRRRCCPCAGGVPSYRCHCNCHMVFDVHYWDTVAFIWVCDANTNADMRNAWDRFRQAYPEHPAAETFDTFWSRLTASSWYQIEGHKHQKKVQDGYN